MVFGATAVLTAAQLNDLSITKIDVADGTVIVPSISNTGDSNTGIYFPSADNIAFTAAGVQRVAITVNGLAVLDGTAGAPPLTNIGDGDTGLYFPSADTIGLTTGGALRATVSASGIVVDSGAMQVPNGADATPTMAFTSDPDTGFYRDSVNKLGIATGGTERIVISNNGVVIRPEIYGPDGTEGDPTYSFSGSTDTGMYLSNAAAGTMRHTVNGVDIVEVAAISFAAADNSLINLGLGARRWLRYYGVNADDISSDMRLKDRIGESLGLEFICALDTFEGRWKDNSIGDEAHQWLSAQNVAATLIDFGIDPADSALWAEDENGAQSLAYTEFIPPVIASIQELRAEMRELRELATA